MRNQIGGGQNGLSGKGSSRRRFSHHLRSKQVVCGGHKSIAGRHLRRLDGKWVVAVGPDVAQGQSLLLLLFTGEGIPIH